MDLFYRKIYYGLYDNGNGILGIGWEKGGLEGHEHLSPQDSIITEDGGCTQTGRHRVVS